MKNVTELKRKNKKTDSAQKRRGRKPKTDVSTVSEKPGKPSRKKTKDRSYGVNTNIDESLLTTPVDTIILHLPVHTEDLNRTSTGEEIPREIESSTLLTSHASWIGGAQAQPMEDISESGFAQYPFTKSDEIIEVLGEPTWANDSGLVQDQQQSWIVRDNVQCDHLHNWNQPFHVDKDVTVEYTRKTDTLMKPFVEANHRGEWPKSTPIHCFWCCHPFENAPCALPVDYRNGTFSVYGCFCSPECTAAYNFNDFQDTENRWERYSLLNLMVKKLYANLDSRIKLAPPRQTLEIFGGPMSIEQFRQTLENYTKTYVVNMPPLISIHAQQEQINFDSNPYGKRDASLFIPVDHDRVSEASENLKLRRKKPVSDAKNTLESCMNLQFR